MRKHFTFDRNNGFVVHLDPENPEIPVYLGKAQALRGGYFAVFAYQGDGELDFIVRDDEQLNKLQGDKIPQDIKTFAIGQIADSEIKADFFYDNYHPFGNIYWPNTTDKGKSLLIGLRISRGAYHQANEEVTANTPFLSLCPHTGSNAELGTITRTRIGGTWDARFG